MIFFDNVSKIYNDNSIALEGVTLSIEPEEFVSVVGQSGAGKSTPINLLCLFYYVDEGRILIDGREIKKDPAIWRPVIMLTVLNEMPNIPNKNSSEDLKTITKGRTMGIMTKAMPTATRDPINELERPAPMALAPSPLTVIG